MLFQTNNFSNFSIPAKSQRIQTQFQAVRDRLAAIVGAARKFGLDPHLLAAIMSRETDVETSSAYRSLNQYGIPPAEQLNRIRATLDRNVRAGQITESQRQAYLEMNVANFPGLHADERCWGDGGAQGYGPMQLDYRYNAHLILKILALPTRAQRLQTILEEGAGILSANLKIAERRFPAAGALRHMQAAIAAYNCGFGNITDINNPDAKTTGGDYAGDVIGRMLLLAQAGVLGSNFSGGGTTPPPPNNNTNTPPPQQPQTPSGRTYTVVAGDTGGRIAQKLGVTLNALAAANPGVDWTRLRIGQSLNTPGGGGGTKPTPTPTPPTPVQPSNDIRLLDTHRAQVEALLQQVTSLVRAYPLQAGQPLLLTGTQANLLQNFVNRANDLLLTYNGANQAQRQLFDNKYPNYIRTTQEQRDWLRNSYMPYVRTSSPQQTSRPSIQGSVGRNAQNLRADALLVQELLNKQGFPVSTDGAVGPKTIAAIEAFQRQKLGISNPDGRIEPNGSDWFGLIA